MHIGLGGNNLGKEGIMCILHAAMKQKHQNITYLDVSNNNPGGLGAKEFNIDKAGTGIFLGAKSKTYHPLTSTSRYTEVESLMPKKTKFNSSSTNTQIEAATLPSTPLYEVALQACATFVLFLHACKTWHMTVDLIVYLHKHNTCRH